MKKFQSQTRSQSPGDFEWSISVPFPIGVSIADAKPIPWRHAELQTWLSEQPSFNRRREANPLATVNISTMKRAYLKVSIADAKPIPWRLLFRRGCHMLFNSFNRRREANPL